MMRYRWVQTEWPVEIRTLAKRISKLGFTESSGHGFILDRVRDDYVEARYVERVEYSDSVFDPFGNEIKFDRLDYRQTRFRACSGVIGLEISDPGRSVLALTQRLSEATDFRSLILPVKINPIDWTRNFLSLIDEPAAVNSILIGSLFLDNGVNAKVLARGDGDVASACNQLVQNRAHTVDKIQIIFPSRKRLSTVALSSNGGAAMNSLALAEDLLPMLRASLAATFPGQLPSP